MRRITDGRGTDMTTDTETPDTDLTSDPQLASAAREGDEAAFVRLYERHSPTAWRTSLAITGDPDEAGATVTEGFARAFTALRVGRYSPDTTFRSLLLTSVRNSAIDRRRARADESDTAAGFDYAADDETRMLAAAFAPLPERWRSVLWLTEVEGLRSGQTAQVVGLAPQATTTLAERARKGLREQYLQALVERTESRNCSRSVARLGAYVSGVLDPSDVDKVERHLRLCEACTDHHKRLSDLGPRLRLLVLPVPTSLADETRAAWAAAVVDPAGSGTGLSATAEKVLAGASAFVAVVGVLGATMFGATDDTGGDERAVAPIVTDTTDSEPGNPATPLRLPLAESIGGSVGAIADSAGSAARQSAASGTDGGDTAVSASSPGDGATPAGDKPAAPRTDDAGPAAPPAVNPEPAPAATISTTVADQPIAVEVGEDPGVTAGPITTGSEPEPKPDDSFVAVGGPLEPLAAVVEPVAAAVNGLIG